MNKLSTIERKQVIACLVDGNSLRATTRITGIHRTTVMKLLNDLRAACQEYHDEALVNLLAKLIQCDEIWSFVGRKEKERHRGQEDRRPGRLLDLGWHGCR